MTRIGRIIIALFPTLLLLAGCGSDPTLYLNSFETDEDLDRLVWRCPYWIEQTGRFVTHGEFGLLVELPPGDFPTLELREVPADWRGYSWFVADFSAPDLAGAELLIRIDDEGPSDRFADRFTATTALTGGPQTVRLPIERIRRGNGGRELDLKHIDRVLFFLKHAKQRHILLLDGVRLEK